MNDTDADARRYRTAATTISSVFRELMNQGVTADIVAAVLIQAAAAAQVAHGGSREAFIHYITAVFDIVAAKQRPA